MFKSHNRIVVTAEVAAVAAIKDYENISGADPYNIPEYWIVCRIASDLAGQSFIVECEKRIDEIVVGKRLGRVDLAVYSTAEQNENKLLRALIEVKGPRTTWPSFLADFVRLREIAKELSASDVLIGLVYAAPPMTAVELNKEQEKIKRVLAAGDVGPEKLKFSERQHLQRRHKDRTPGVNDVWEIMSVFDRVV